MHVFAPRRSAPARSRNLAGFVALCGVVLVGAIIAVGVPLIQDRAPETEDVLLGILATATLLPSAIALLRKDGDVLAPLPVLGGLFFLYYVVRGLYLKYGSPGVDDLPPNLGFEYPRWMIPALTLNLACWVAAMLGYVLPLTDRISRLLPPPKKLSAALNEQGVIVVWLIGVFFRGVQVARGTHLAFAKAESADASTQAYVDMFCRLDLMAVFLLGALFFQRRLSPRGRILLFAVVLPEALLVGLMAGSKFLMMLPLFCLVFALHYFRRRIGLRDIVIMLALLVFVALPFGQSMRNAYGTTAKTDVTKFDLDTTADTARLAAEQVRENASDDLGGYVEEALRSTTGRTHGLDSSMVALKMTPDILPYAEGQTYYLAPLLAVAPRIIWKQKPSMDPVPNWATEYWGQSPDSPSSIAITHTAALYLAFGWTGAVLGMFLLGTIWRFVYRWLNERPGPLASLCYVFFLLGIYGIENDIPSVYIGLTKTALTLALVAWLAAVRVPEMWVRPHPRGAIPPART